jgi:hypothetical protein
MMMEMMMNRDSRIGGVVVTVITLSGVRGRQSGEDEFFGYSSCRRYATDQLGM